MAAYAVVEDAQGRILLSRLSIDEPDREKWTLPGGGLDFGEDPEAGALRELEEETGLQRRVTALLGVDSRVYGPNPIRSGALHGIGIIYRVAVEADELRHETGGSTDRADWFSRAEMDALPLVDLVQAGLAMLERSQSVRNA